MANKSSPSSYEFSEKNFLRCYYKHRHFSHISVRIWSPHLTSRPSESSVCESYRLLAFVFTTIRQHAVAVRPWVKEEQKACIAIGALTEPRASIHVHRIGDLRILSYNITSRPSELRLAQHAAWWLTWSICPARLLNTPYHLAPTHTHTHTHTRRPGRAQGTKTKPPQSALYEPACPLHLRTLGLGSTQTLSHSPEARAFEPFGFVFVDFEFDNEGRFQFPLPCPWTTSWHRFYPPIPSVA